jgi:hypothetical protein
MYFFTLRLSPLLKSRMLIEFLFLTNFSKIPTVYSPSSTNDAKLSFLEGILLKIGNFMFRRWRSYSSGYIAYFYLCKAFFFASRTFLIEGDF